MYLTFIEFVIQRQNASLFIGKNPLLQRRLDYLFTSNMLQEFIGDVKVLPSFMSDHSPVSISVNLQPKISRGKYGWKFNNSLLQNEDFSSGMKRHFQSLTSDLDYLSDPHLNGNT